MQEKHLWQNYFPCEVIATYARQREIMSLCDRVIIGEDRSVQEHDYSQELCVPLAADMADSFKSATKIDANLGYYVDALIQGGISPGAPLVLGGCHVEACVWDFVEEVNSRNPIYTSKDTLLGWPTSPSIADDSANEFYKEHTVFFESISELKECLLKNSSK
jgi:hypothetical protein